MGNVQVREDELEFIRDENGMPLILGKGASGLVKLAIFNNKQVAVKYYMNFHEDEEMVKEAKLEKELMGALSHPNVVQFLGYNFDAGFLLLEYVDYGDLYTSVPKPQARLDRFGWRLMLGIAEGLAFLHSKGILHLDLKSLNVLLTRRWLPKITDVGLARKIQRDKGSKTNQNHLTMNAKFTTQWAPPENFERPFILSFKSDVYSMGVIMWEIVTGGRPWAAEKTWDLPLKVLAGDRPVIPKTCPPELKALIESAWHNIPDKRPTAKELLTTLQEMVPSSSPSPGSHTATSGTSSSSELMTPRPGSNTSRSPKKITALLALSSGKNSTKYKELLATGETEELIWELLDPKGNPGKILSILERTYQYQNTRVAAGLYRCSVSTSDLRSIIATVQVLSIYGKKIFQGVIDISNKEESLYFDVLPEDTPASITIDYRIRSPGVVSGIKARTRVTRLVPQALKVEKEKNLHDVSRQVIGDSLALKAGRERVLSDGLIRPYLLLLTMHPTAREEVARTLTITLKDREDPHEVASEVLYKKTKGLVDRVSGGDKKGKEAKNVAQLHPDWYRLLHEAALEGFKVPLTEETNPAPTKAFLVEMEALFMEKLAEFLLQKMSKEVNQKLDESLAICMSTEVEIPEVEGEADEERLCSLKDLLQKLEVNGFGGDSTKKFVLSFFLGGDPLLTVADMVAVLQEKLFSKDPSGDAAKKAQKDYKPRVKTVVKKALLMTAVPTIGIAFVANVASLMAQTVLDPKNPVLVSVANIIFQRLLLIVQDIRLEDYH